MRAWIVRFASLYIFDLVVLLLIGWLTPGVSVGWAAFWAAVILTAATIWLKPLIHRWFRGMAAKSQNRRTKIGEKLVQYGLVFVVALIVWVLVVVLTRVNVSGWFWGYVLPPVALLIAWAIYDLIDDRIEARAGVLYDSATARVRGGRSTVDAVAQAPDSPAASAGRRELKDGLTDEQRRMLDEL
ncbi:MAG: hypothetical protein DI573_03465 [Microbacterium sp.]|uniref:hypothetical protein n=1 Tax=Microbacterium sp. TaxID=51671 RepID=UPI000DB277FB|nr:hypothetical protein [Microbacterium sp.]PZU40691.1 MAG: hypothetical protein DI573_03465 [Microbacterium sp.]